MHFSGRSSSLRPSRSRCHPPPHRHPSPSSLVPLRPSCLLLSHSCPLLCPPDVPIHRDLVTAQTLPATLQLETLMVGTLLRTQPVPCWTPLQHPPCSWHLSALMVLYSPSWPHSLPPSDSAPKVPSAGDSWLPPINASYPSDITAVTSWKGAPGSESVGCSLMWGEVKIGTLWPAVPHRQGPCPGCSLVHPWPWPVAGAPAALQTPFT